MLDMLFYYVYDEGDKRNEKKPINIKHDLTQRQREEHKPYARSQEQNIERKICEMPVQGQRPTKKWPKNPPSNKIYWMRSFFWGCYFLDEPRTIDASLHSSPLQPN